jgi:hypothetical protein
MFQLYDATRRRICVAAFLTFGVLPALLVGGWCWSRRTWSSLQAEAEQLSRQLGLNVKLGGLKHLRPGAVLYEQFAAADPETGRPIFRCRLLEIAWRPAKGSPAKSRPTLLLTASQPEVEAASLDRVWQCLQRPLRGLCGPLEADLQLVAAELTLRGVDNSQTLTEVSGAVESLPQGTHARLDFRLAGVSTPQPVHIGVTRNRQVSPPASGFELDTGGGELPCSLLAMGLDELKPLGSRCRFRGMIWASEMPDGWEGEVAGQLLDLDLGGLVSNHFPHKLSGTGQVTVQSARFRHGRLERGSALVVAGPGRIDHSLLAAATDRLGLAPAAEPLPNGDLVEYQQLAFSATLDAQGLVLHGRCDAAERGVILSDGRHRLLGESPQPAPAVALVRTLVPQSAVQVPASRESEWLLRHLPVPTVMPLPGADAVAPRAQVRLRDRDTFR